MYRVNDVVVLWGPAQEKLRESITAKGQEMIKQLQIKMIDVAGYHVTADNTDSLYCLAHRDIKGKA